MSGFRLHPRARRDLNEILDYIGVDNHEAADRVLNEIYQACQSLAKFSHQGRTRSDLTSRPLRFWRVREYLIAYAPDEKPLWVLAIMHGRRSPRVMAAILSARTF